MAPRLCFVAAPKFVNTMLTTDRFMAFAIRRVSCVPAAPTTMPAIISAGFCSTKPSSPTARPVKPASLTRLAWRDEHVVNVPDLLVPGANDPDEDPEAGSGS